MKKEEILEIYDKYIAKSAKHPSNLVWTKAIGDKIYSENKEYIDFSSGIFVVNSGHSSINKYLIEQINKNLIYSYCYLNEPQAKLAKKLIEITPNYLEKVVFADSGANAVEIACKLVRLGRVKRDRWSGKIIVSIKGAMHGKTFLAEKLSGGKYWNNNHNPDFQQISFPNKNSVFIKDMGTILAKRPACNIAAVILESYQGWSGRFMPKKYVQDIAKFCKKHGIALIFDDVQGGFWRTGKLFAYEHYGVEPDLVCLGKGLGGGVPISAVVGRADILDIGEDLTSTYSGNPLCCAGAYGNLLELDKLNHKLLQNNGLYLNTVLKGFKKKYNIVKQARSKGLLGAIVTEDTKTATKIVKLAEEKGLLVVYTARNSVKIGPPLTIPVNDLLKGYEILESCIKEVDNETI